MKFLQKQRDEPEVVARPNLAKKKRKKDQKQTKEGEISAFFTSVHPVLVEKDSNRLPEHAASRNERCRRDHPPRTQRLTWASEVEALNMTVLATYLGQSRFERLAQNQRSPAALPPVTVRTM
ncbi:unnamed protein product [Alternaria alternata]